MTRGKGPLTNLVSRLLEALLISCHYALNGGCEIQKLEYNSISIL